MSFPRLSIDTKNKDQDKKTQGSHAQVGSLLKPGSASSLKELSQGNDEKENEGSKLPKSVLRRVQSLSSVASRHGSQTPSVVTLSVIGVFEISKEEDGDELVDGSHQPDASPTSMIFSRHGNRLD